MRNTQMTQLSRTLNPWILLTHPVEKTAMTVRGHRDDSVNVHNDGEDDLESCNAGCVWSLRKASAD